MELPTNLLLSPIKKWCQSSPTRSLSLGKSICAKTCFWYLIHPMNQIAFPSGLNHCLTQHTRRNCRLSLPRLRSWLSPGRGGEKAGKRFYTCVKRGVRSWMEHDFEVWKKNCRFSRLSLSIHAILAGWSIWINQIRHDVPCRSQSPLRSPVVCRIADVVPPQQAGDEAQWWR